MYYFVLLLLLSMFWKFIHVVVCVPVIYSFSLLNVFHFMNFLIYSPVDGHLIVSCVSCYEKSCCELLCASLCKHSFNFSWVSIRNGITRLSM